LSLSLLKFVGYDVEIVHYDPENTATRWIWKYFERKMTSGEGLRSGIETVCERLSFQFAMVRMI
jgi:hypothetical protein